VDPPDHQEGETVIGSGPVPGVLAPGATFAGYIIEGVAGRGGMGVVYRARELRPARTVAIKVISPALAADAGFRERFERESDVAATIEHSNVLPVFRVGEEAGLLFLAMRFVEGTDLAAIIADGGRLEPRRAVDIFVQVCSALDAAHARGLVHRDVKPANVLIAREGGREHVYLTDFGLAKHHDAVGGPTATGYFMGTLDYAAPEQFESGQLDARTDVYAAGCMLYHSLAGRVPFPAENPAARMFAHLTTDPPSVLDIDASLPGGLDAVIARAMAKDPDARYLSAGDLARAAKAAVEGHTLTRAEHSVATGAAADHADTQLVPLSELVTVAPAVPLSPPPGFRPPPASPSSPSSPAASGPAAATSVPGRPRRTVIAVVAAVSLVAVAVAVALRAGSGPDKQTGSSEPSTTTASTAGSASSAPASFASTLTDRSEATGLIAFLRSHDDRVVHLDVHCSGSDAAPCSSTQQAELAVYTEKKCGSASVGGACAGAWWFDIRDANRDALTANEVGAGSLKVKGFFTVKVQGVMGSKPPEVMNVLLTAVSPKDVPSASSAPPKLSTTLTNQSTVNDFLGFLRSHDDQVVQLDVHCDGSDAAPCSSSGIPALAVYTSAKCADGACAGAWWFEFRNAKPTTDAQGAGSLVVKGLFAVQVQGALGSKPPDVMNVQLTAV
jgi:serine/threonine protein kinase